MSENKAIVVLSDKARSYVDLYERVVAPARSRWTDDVLSALWMDRIARNRRLARVRKVTERIDEVREQAVTTLAELLSGARELRRKAQDSNSMAIGSLTRSRSDRQLAREQVESLIERCTDTLRFVEERNGMKLPERWEEWPRIGVVMDDPGGILGLERLVHHQRRWQAVLENIARVEASEAEIAKAEQSLVRSNQIEQKCARFLERLETEERLVSRRFDDLEAEIRVGELESIVGTLTAPKDGRAPLLEIRAFELLDEDTEATPKPT